MSQPSSSFQDLFNAALQEYENQTGCKLIEHPLANQFKTCDSVQSITAILQEQTQIFSGFKGDDGKLMKSLKSSVGVLYTLSNTGVFGGSIGLVHPTSFIGVNVSNRHFHRYSPLRVQCSLASLSYLPYIPLSDPISMSLTLIPQAVKDISSSYDALIDLFASFETFLSRLSIYSGVPPTPALTNVLVKIIAELLSTLALATKQVKQGRFSESVLVGTTLDSVEHREICEEASGRE